MDSRPQTIHTSPRSRWSGLLANPWTGWWCQVGAALTMAAWLGLVAIPNLRGEMEWVRYCAILHTLKEIVQAMPAKALARQRSIQLQVDALRGTFRVAVAQAPHAYDIVEQTLWLPKGLQISDAPGALTAFPTGRLSSSSIVVAAPSYSRLFRLTTNEDGRVELHEESTL